MKGGMAHLMYHGHGVEEHQRAARRRHLHHALPWVRQRLDAAERGARCEAHGSCARSAKANAAGDIP